MPRAKKVKESPVTKKEPKFSLEVHFNDTVYKAKAETLVEALNDFITSQEFPFSVKTRTLVRYSKGDVTRQRLWFVPEARRTLTLISTKPASLELLAEKLTKELA